MIKKKLCKSCKCGFIINQGVNMIVEMEMMALYEKTGQSKKNIYINLISFGMVA